MPEKPTESALDPSMPPALTTFEQELIEVFVRAAQLLSLPKSVGEIYGLLYASEKPLALDQIVAVLRISKGSASQGLRFLHNLAAVKRVYVPGDRRDHFEAEVRLRRLGNGLMRERVEPHLESGQERLERLDSLAEDISPHLKERYEKLRSWHRRARRILPIARRFFSPDQVHSIAGDPANLQFSSHLDWFRAKNGPSDQGGSVDASGGHDLQPSRPHASPA